MYNLVVFASGNGSTLQAIIDSIDSGDLHAKINLVVSNNENAYALERAKQSGIETYVIKAKDFEQMDIELSEKLSHYDINLIVLAGYLRKIGSKLISNYTIINTHPSLLPKFGGKGMYGLKVHTAVINEKEEFSGVTLHYVNENYDDGDIIKQTTVPVFANDTPESLSQRVQAVEKIQLIDALKEFAN